MGGLGSVMALACLVAARLGAAAQTSRSEALPSGASTIIESALEAARVRDLTALRSLMITGFLWSFGGDRDVTQAVEAWKSDSRYLDEMVRVLRQGCHIDSREYRQGALPPRVRGPGAGGKTFHPGLIGEAGRWGRGNFNQSGLTAAPIP